MTANSPFQGFSKLDFEKKLQLLHQQRYLDESGIKHFLDAKLPSLTLAEKFIENAIGYFNIPIGVAVNFNIDERDYVIPMAVEETSIIAAASKTARWISNDGKITTGVKGHLSIGQIQLAEVKNFKTFQKLILENQENLMEETNHDVASGLVTRGGGVKEIQIRKIIRPDQKIMAIIHILVDTCDAMGANIINQICEFLKPRIEKLTQEVVTMCILSNLNDTRLTWAKVEVNHVSEEMGQRIQEASIFAECDPYRAATNNKGILNGMDPILVATGNDWRAVEAGAHAYACRDGQYRSLSTWRYKNQQLTGYLEAPIMVGTIGGMTKLHPTAQHCLAMMNIEHSDDLARVIAAVGLVQNLGAIRALTQEGIIQGHMKLHIDNIILSSGATDKEAAILKIKLADILTQTHRISLRNALDILNEIRGN